MNAHLFDFNDVPTRAEIPKIHLLVQHHLGCSFGEDAITTVVTDDRAHRLAHRIERVDVMERFLRMFVAYLLVRICKVKDETQQGALGLVAHLLVQFRRILGWLSTQKDKSPSRVELSRPMHVPGSVMYKRYL